jgi:tetratricopeptide (TPR) repeat protein
VKLGKLEEGSTAIERYIERHPDDKVGHYELAQAQRSLDEAKALEHFDRALQLDPQYAPALAARGSLYYQAGKFEPARRDLETAAALDPADAATWDRLGQTYQSLDRTTDAVRVLRKAAELTPGDSKVLLHFGRALADSGHAEESKAVMDRFRHFGPEKKNVVPEGLVSYLALSPGQRRADYRARLEKSLAEHPDDAAAMLEYLKVLLEAHESDAAAKVAKKLAALKPEPEVAAEAGHALLDAQRFDLAREMLQPAGATTGLALATFEAAPSPPAARSALAILDRIPEAQRDGEFELARARMLDASGKPQESAAAIERAVQRSGDRAEIRLRAAAFLIQKQRAADALRFLDGSDDRRVLLLKATTLELLHRGAESAAVLQQLRARWPEWSAAWSAAGIIDAIHQRPSEAAKAFDAAVALGARDAETNYFRNRTNPVDDRPHLDRFFAGSLVVSR